MAAKPKINLSKFIQFVGTARKPERRALVQQWKRDIAVPYDTKSDWYKKLRKASPEAVILGRGLTIADFPGLEQRKVNSFLTAIENLNDFADTADRFEYPVSRCQVSLDFVVVKARLDLVAIRSNRRIAVHVLYKKNPPLPKVINASLGALSIACASSSAEYSDQIILCTGNGAAYRCGPRSEEYQNYAGKYLDELNEFWGLE